VNVEAQLNLSEDEAEEYSLYWESGDIPSPIISGLTLSFDPSSMLDGEYPIKATLDHNSDSSLDIFDEQYLKVSLNKDDPKEPQLSEPTDIQDGSGGGNGIAILLGLLGLAVGRRVIL
jgi:hypothetical protein